MKPLIKVDKVDGAAGVERDAAGQVVRVKTGLRAGGVIRDTGQYAKDAWAKTDDFFKRTWEWLW